MEYTTIIRTLGTAGDKYQTLLDSLNRQNLQPSNISIYIAKRYAISKETIRKKRQYTLCKSRIYPTSLNT